MICLILLFTFQGTAVEGTDYTFTDPLTITFDYDASEVSVPLTINNADSEPKGGPDHSATPAKSTWRFHS